jgi:hypothetical protein
VSYDVDPERKQELTSVALKVAGVVLGIGLLVGLGSWLMVSALGLDSGDGDPTPDARVVEPVQPLPTTALPVPSESVPADPNDQPTVPPSTAPPSTGLQLHASPAHVAPMERINLTGIWPGRDNVGLAVQRLENGQWEDFAGVSATVRVGTFETYVMTGREGVQQFRMFDPDTGTASNAVRVTVG